MGSELWVSFREVKEVRFLESTAETPVELVSRLRVGYFVRRMFYAEAKKIELFYFLIKVIRIFEWNRFILKSME